MYLLYSGLSTIFHTFVIKMAIASFSFSSSSPDGGLGLAPVNAIISLMLFDFSMHKAKKLTQDDVIYGMAPG